MTPYSRRERKRQAPVTCELERALIVFLAPFLVRRWSARGPQASGRRTVEGELLRQCAWRWLLRYWCHRTGKR